MTVKEEALRLTPRQREGRAINAVAELLRRTLSVPNIYLEPPSSLISADVLAVDRGGAGDLHAAEIKLFEEKRIIGPVGRRLEIVRSVYSPLMSMPAHYRYLAITVENFDMLRGDLAKLGLYAEDGIGRIGIITIAEKGADSPIAEIALAPERFRVDPAKLKAIETKLLAKSRPDIEVRI
ncbi:MAG: hypothetical protein ACLGP3_03840 [Acidobacteriota bacterium]